MARIEVRTSSELKSKLHAFQSEVFILTGKKIPLSKLVADILEQFLDGKKSTKKK